MSDHHHGETVPRRVLIGAAALVALTITAAAVGRLTGSSQTTLTAAAVQSRELVFRDVADGSIAVFDARDTSTPIDVVPPATNGFLRGTMRGLARQRLRQDADRDIPFRLTQWADNRLTLEDPTTHRMLDLEAFGLTNEQAFARLLSAKVGS
jgi:putative photosynthetic complex assembly protein